MGISLIEIVDLVFRYQIGYVKVRRRKINPEIDHTLLFEGKTR